MQDEIYDIFNDAWEKIGTASWTEVHSKGLIHENATAMVFKDATKKEVLLQRRSMKMKQSPGLLTNSAGGHLKTGVSADDGMREELQEELFAGHELPALTITKIARFLNEDIPNNKEILNVYEVVWPGPFYFDAEELEHPPEWLLWDDLIADIKLHPEKYTKVLRNILMHAYHVTL